MGIMIDMMQAIKPRQKPEELPITSIRSQNQARKYFDPKQLEKLKRSIEEVGILQPLVVIPENALQYRLIAGERRYRAAQLAGLTTVPVVILNPDEWTPAKLQALTLLENLQRQDLNKFEETLAILELLALEFDMPTTSVPQWLMRLDNEHKNKSTRNVSGTNNDIQSVNNFFEKLGLINWKSFVRSRLPLLKLPEDIKNSLLQGKIPYTCANALKTITDETERSYWLAQAEAGASVRKIKQANRRPLEFWQTVYYQFQKVDWQALSQDTRSQIEQKLKEALALLPPQ